MKLLLAVMFASLYGLSMRLLFGIMGPSAEIMGMSFLFLVPLCIGFFTVLISNVKSAAGAFFSPWLTSLVLLVITIALNIEGAICWIMVFPFFAVLSGFGGIIAYIVKKRNSDKDYNRPNGVQVSALVLLPLCTGLIENDSASTTQVFTVTRQEMIAATPQKVWHELTNINTIQPHEHKAKASQQMGFPRHTSTVIDTLAVGGRRRADFEKGLFFDETIMQLEPERKLVLAIKADPEKIPPTVMDEHILIGGKHLDIHEDTYTLSPAPGNKCVLTLSSRFSICTPFNWYAALWADYLMADILDGELSIIRQRATSGS